MTGQEPFSHPGYSRSNMSMNDSLPHHRPPQKTKASNLAIEAFVWMRTVLFVTKHTPLARGS